MFLFNGIFLPCKYDFMASNKNSPHLLEKFLQIHLGVWGIMALTQASPEARLVSFIKLTVRAKSRLILTMFLFYYC